MIKSEKILNDWNKFCQEQENCEKCPYGNEVHCTTVYAYDAGIKFAYDAAVNLIGTYKDKEVQHD